ncbi:P-loop containing nucleoside triphosphate hydrolase protein, partial [Coemansia spiralis]
VFKAVMFGAPRSGKTSLRNYFLYKNHTCQYLPTQNSDFVSTYVVLEKRQMIAMQIWDTGGSPVDRLTTSSLAQDADAIILVYDGTNPASLHALEPFLKRSKTIVDAVLPMVLVGTKADLPQEVNCAQAMDFCKSIADVDIVCIKTSARTGSNIEAVFQKVAELCQQ